MSHLTVVIPFVPIGEAHVNATEVCIDSIKPHADRIILIQNGIGHPVRPEIVAKADVHLLNQFNILMAGAVNQGYCKAVEFPDCEFIMFVNNDIRFPEGFPKDALCVKGAMMSPKIGSQNMGYGSHASCFVIHKDDFKAIGYWNLIYGHASDDNWFKRARDKIGMGNTPYEVAHEHPAMTNNDVTDFIQIL